MRADEIWTLAAARSFVLATNTTWVLKGGDPRLGKGLPPYREPIQAGSLISPLVVSNPADRTSGWRGNYSKFFPLYNLGL